MSLPVRCVAFRLDQSVHRVAAYAQELGRLHPRMVCSCISFLLLLAQATGLYAEVCVLDTPFRQRRRRVRRQPGVRSVITLAYIRHLLPHFGIGRPLLFEVMQVAQSMHPTAMMPPGDQVVGRIEIGNPFVTG
jgi:hypothetical protein